MNRCSFSLNAVCVQLIGGPHDGETIIVDHIDQGIGLPDGDIMFEYEKDPYLPKHYRLVNAYKYHFEPHEVK